jgi:hypothetical protein
LTICPLGWYTDEKLDPVREQDKHKPSVAYDIKLNAFIADELDPLFQYGTGPFLRLARYRSHQRAMIGSLHFCTIPPITVMSARAQFDTDENILVTTTQSSPTSTTYTITYSPARIHILRVSDIISTLRSPTPFTHSTGLSSNARKLSIDLRPFSNMRLDGIRISGESGGQSLYSAAVEISPVRLHNQTRH